MFLDPAAFPFTAVLEAGWRDVRRELDALLAAPDARPGAGPVGVDPSGLDALDAEASARFQPWPERHLYGRGWDVFGLVAAGRRLDAGAAACPATAGLLARVPGLTTAGFSAMQPGTRIAPHVGYTKAVLRCHLGLLVPDGCGLRVGEETRSWEEGRCLVFDDTVRHEAWNASTAVRVVLLVDFVRP